MYFSPTGTTKKIVEEMGARIVEIKNIETVETVETIDFTLPIERECARSFQPDDLLLIGVPVYAGRVPNILLNYLNTIKGNNTHAIPIVLYGNRNYDDALIELNDLLIANGFRVLAAASFIGEHSFSTTLGQDRPDQLDLSIARGFADSVCEKLAGNAFEIVNIKGNRPYRPYYRPKDEEGKWVDIRKVTPKTDNNCIDCKICANVCPMGSIDYDDVTKMIGICIKCGACVKLCPTQSKYFDDPDYLRHKQELEVEFAERREPELFI